MLQKALSRANPRTTKLLQRGFSTGDTHWGNIQPPAVGSVSDYHLDTKQANSKYYNPTTFDPQALDYQQDVRLAVRDEIPDEIDSTDIAESIYNQLIMGELTWTTFFFGGWAAFEPDVSSL